MQKTKKFAIWRPLYSRWLRCDTTRRCSEAECTSRVLMKILVC